MLRIRDGEKSGSETQLFGTFSGFPQNMIIFHPKILLKLSEIMVGSGIQDPEKTYPGSRIQGSKRYQIPDPDPQH